MTLKNEDQCPKCKLPHPKQGESAIGKELCLCNSRMDFSLGYPILVEKPKVAYLVSSISDGHNSEALKEG